MSHQRSSVLNWFTHFADWFTTAASAITRYFRVSRLQGFLLVGAIGFSAALLIPGLASTAIAQSSRQPQIIAQKPPVQVTLVAYAVPKPAHDKILAAFKEKWKREKGQDIVFSQSYGGSGSQARAIIDGLEADLVHLALEFDVNAIAKRGLLNPNWKQTNPGGGIVAKSTVAIVTRPGNPKRIREFADLAKPGIQIVTANPKTSGGARWNFLALWGSVTQNGGSEDQARQFVGSVYRNAAALPRDAREATDAFLKKGQGDVLLNWEHEMVYAAQQGQAPFFTVIPQLNISADTPLALIDKSVDKHGNREVVEALVKYFHTPESQREFAKLGYRVTDPNVAKEFERKLPRISKLYTIDTFGGWDAAQAKFFSDGGVFDQIQGSR